MEDGKCTSIVSLDLSATFDMVNHTILLEVLNCYFGITETCTLLDFFILIIKKVPSTGRSPNISDS